MLVSNIDTPYYAVIFSTVLSENIDGYEKTSERMITLAKQQEGFLGIESARNSIGITVSYWSSLEAISKWKNNLEHTEARVLGREKWYAKYQLRICKVERAYSFEK
ncbi:antibiotic biosynthesis monooxygenase family protein [Polaribacter tangerinus]|uniref:antibiotic biosynthesis monooxygenase family protein n=1 Tax=Polaribacter tangerinus TaxID=1920034 RepID=UPI000B4A6BD0|nr:antibiotic biosynthesis monooxygenase [Polaribacter tangerinus]